MWRRRCKQTHGHRWRTAGGHLPRVILAIDELGEIAIWAAQPPGQGFGEEAAAAGPDNGRVRGEVLAVDEDFRVGLDLRKLPPRQEMGERFPGNTAATAWLK
jgi:hypothetical protein